MSSKSGDRKTRAKDPTTLATVRLLLVSWLLAAVCLATVGGKKSEKPPTSVRANAVNPNDAPWWELTVLPEVGPALARQIVDYREKRRSSAEASSNEVVFRSASDLDAVRGIGPKTIARLAPHLCFDGAGLTKPPGSIDDHRQPQNEQN